MRVREGREDATFATKSCRRGRATPRRKQLDRDALLEVGALALGEPHLAHAAAPEQRDQPKRPHTFARLGLGHPLRRGSFEETIGSRVGLEQTLGLGAHGEVRLRVEQRDALVRREIEGAVGEVQCRARAILGRAHRESPSSARMKARALRKARRTVRTSTASASAISTLLETAKESPLEHACEPRVDCLELAERVVHGEHEVDVGAHRLVVDGRRDEGPAATLGRASPPRVIDEDLPHRGRGDCEEVRTTLDAVLGRELHPRLVHERRRVERPRFASAKLARREPPKDRVDRAEGLVARRRSARAHSRRVLRCVARRGAGCR